MTWQGKPLCWLWWLCWFSVALSAPLQAALQQQWSATQGVGAASFRALQWHSKGQWQLSDHSVLQASWQLHEHNQTAEVSPSLRQTVASWAEVQQLALKVQHGAWQYSAGLLAPDWRLTDTVAVADVWTSRDLRDVVQPQSLAHPAVRASWQGNGVLRHVEWIWTPQQRSQQQPSGLWRVAQQPVLPAMPTSDAVGLKLAGQLGSQRWQLWGFQGHKAAAQWTLPTTADAAGSWQYPAQTAIGLSWQSELGDGWQSRTELGHIRLPTEHYLHWVQAMEYEWLGEQSSTVLLLQYSQTWQQAGQAPWLSMDMNRQLAGFWLGRLQYDPQGDMRQQWQLEWSLGRDNGYWQARWQQRLGDNHQLDIRWRQLHGTAQTLFGPYRQLDGLDLTWRYWF